ncbi:MAG TPA: SDR family NAD(P)-dependent oxidoreductase [Pyrinomonadaceae bacterium]|jgi:xylan 1,4-beta-xylosidase
MSTEDRERQGAGSELTASRPEVVVVTGASAGLGRAIVRAFAREGAHLGLLARGCDGLEGARRDVEALGGRALVLPTDVADAEGVERATEAVEREFGPIGIWINNAMVSVFSPVRKMKPEDYFKLYRYTTEAIKEVDSKLRVGGPATAKNEWVEEFLDFCERHNLPADFVTTHHYPTDAFGVEDDDTETQLAQGRRSVLREQAQDMRRRARGKPVYYTEWNTSSNPRDPLHDEPYAAAFVTKTVMEANGLVEGYSFWTFSDIFEENYFPSVPFHGGFGLMNLYGIPKPTYRAFELLHRLGNKLLLVDGSHETVNAWVVRKERSFTVLLTNHALPRRPVKTEQVEVKLSNAPRACYAYVERIDEAHANARAMWREMGEPEYLSAREVELLEEASRMWKEPHSCEHVKDDLYLDITLPPHAVAAITVEYVPGHGGPQG